MLKGVVEFLNGRKYGEELTREEESLLKQLGLVVIFGASDDLMEIRGAIDDEAGCYGGGEVYLSKDGVFEECECDCKYSRLAKESCKMIEAVWDDEGIPWTYKTNIPHRKFNILEYGEIYCKGIIFSIDDLHDNNHHG